MKKVKMVVLISLAVLGVVYAGRGPEGMTSEQKNKQLVKVAIGAIDTGGPAVSKQKLPHKRRR